MSSLRTFRFNLGTSGIEVTIKEVLLITVFEGSFLTIYILQNFSTDYSNFIWPCSQVLGEFICAYRELFSGKIVLELGSGTGICGIIAAKVGCSRVYLTDKFDSQQSIDLCAENLQLNNVQADLLAFDWGRIDESILPKVDCLIGSDCFYDEADFENLLCTISLLLANATDPKKTTFYLAHQLRSTKHSIECLLKKWKLTCKRIPFQSQSSQSDRQVIEIYEIKSCLYD